MEDKVDCPICDRRNIVSPSFLYRFKMCQFCKYDRIVERLTELRRQKV